MPALETRGARGAGADARAQLCPSRRYFDAVDYDTLFSNELRIRAYRYKVIFNTLSLLLSHLLSFILNMPQRLNILKSSKMLAI